MVGCPVPELWYELLWLLTYKRHNDKSLVAYMRTDPISAKNDVSRFDSHTVAPWELSELARLRYSVHLEGLKV